MRCPKCTSIADKVIDSRIARDGNNTRRRRECLECGNRYTTSETLVRDSMVVVKRDGRQEPFDRDKLFRAVRAALCISSTTQRPIWPWYNKTW